ncbi:nitrogen fixation negative regulator NifL [Agarivorans sp. DSG3-1]|uniref:nitrogen fixation negative regulator NifL n=1 Tax=Agarivorans sp. DSG3-1 TaxID=3342249 RepID=UPI00398F3CE1
MMNELKSTMEQAFQDLAPVSKNEILEQCFQILEQMPMAMSISDLKANFLFVNKRFSQVTGYSPNDLLGCNHSLLSFKTTPLDVYQELWSCISTGGSWQGRLINRKKNGQRYLAELSITGLCDSSGNITHYMSVHQDISERHQHQTKAANQKAMVEAVLNTAPVAIALVDESHQVVLDNLAYKTLRSDFSQEPVSVALTQLGQRINNAHHQTEEPFTEGQNFNIEVGKGKRKRWFSCCLSSVKISGAEVDDYFVPKRDRYLVITLSEVSRERRRQEQQRLAELQRSTAESEALHSMQEALHAAIHQIQGPINMIDSALQMFCGGANSCARTNAMQAGLEAGHAAIDQLQSALPEKPQEAVQSVNVNQLVHEVTEMSNQRLLSRSITMQLSLNGTLPPLSGQPSRLRVAIKQLIDNAIEAIDLAKKTRREIVCSTQLVDEDIEITVEDSGPGIKKELQLKVFEPFYSTKPLNNNGCRGVGLSIVQQVVSEHSGTVQYQSTSLGGCKARIVLPLRSIKRGE